MHLPFPDVLAALDQMAAATSSETHRLALHAAIDAVHFQNAIKATFERCAEESTRRAPPALPLTRPLEKWSLDEDVQLRLEFESGMSLDVIAAQHVRTPLEVAERLHNPLGLLTEQAVEDIRAARNRQRAKYEYEATVAAAADANNLEADATAMLAVAELSAEEEAQIFAVPVPAPAADPDVVELVAPELAEEPSPAPAMEAQPPVIAPIAEPVAPVIATTAPVAAPPAAPTPESAAAPVQAPVVAEVPSPTPVVAQPTPSTVQAAPVALPAAAPVVQAMPATPVSQPAPVTAPEVPAVAAPAAAAPGGKPVCTPEEEATIAQIIGKYTAKNGPKSAVRTYVESDRFTQKVRPEVQAWLVTELIRLA